MSPLHRAVLENDLEKLQDSHFIKEWIDVPDALGFTPLEIAKYLGNDEAFVQLGGILPATFLFQPSGMPTPLKLSLKGFENATGIRYRPFLTFSSYDSLREVVRYCPYILRSRMLASDNYEWTKDYRELLLNGKIAQMAIKWIDPLVGYGAFAAEDLPAGSFIGEYTGLVRRLYRRQADLNPYCFHYPTKFWSLKYYVIDSMQEGNLCRFINHSNRPNLEPLCLVDKKMLHLVFVARRGIRLGEQLLFDYGADYWIKRRMVAIS